MRPKNWIVLVLLIILLSPTALGAAPTGAGVSERAGTQPYEPWWYPEWQNRAPISVANPNSADLFNFSFIITIPYDSDMNSNFSDLRFSQHVGADIFEIPYWIESMTAGTSAKVWLKAKYLSYTNETSIYMYYKNPNAKPAGSSDDALALYDDFEAPSLNTTRWNDPHSCDSGTLVSQTGGMLDFTVNTGSSETGGCVISKVILEPGNYIAETKLKFTNYYRSAYGAYAGFTDNVVYDDSKYGNPAKLVSARLWDYTTDSPPKYLNLHVNDMSTLDVTQQTLITTRNMWYRMKTIYTPPTFAKAIFTQLESPKTEMILQNTGTKGITPRYVVLGIGDYETSEHTYFDYIFVRKYAPVEPVGLVGKEELSFRLTSFDVNPAQPIEGEMVTITAVFYNPTAVDLEVPMTFRVGENFSDARSIFEQNITMTLKADTTVKTIWKAVPGSTRIWLGTYDRPLAFFKIQMEPDPTPPVTTVLPLPKYVTSTNFTVSWDTPEEDSSGVFFSVYVSEDDGATFSLWLNWTSNLSGIYPGVEGRKYQFFTLGHDLTGNLEVTKSLPEAQTTVDATPPRSVLLLGAYQRTASFYVNWSANDTVSGLSTYTVFVSDNGGPSKIWQNNVTKRSERYSGAGRHEYKFSVISRDFAGNIEKSTPNNTKTTKVDMAAPQTTLVLAGSTYGSNPTFLTPGTTMTLAAKDDIAAGTTVYSLDGNTTKTYSAPFSGLETGSHNISYWSVDSAGNEEKHQSFWFSVDGDAPMTPLIFDGPSYMTEAVTYLSEGTHIILDSLDEGSGLAATTYRIDNFDPVTYSDPFILERPGIHTIVYSSVDNLGNREESHTYKVQMDSHAPTTIAVAPAVAQRYDFTVKLKTSDTESGIAATYFRVAAPEGSFSDWETGTEIFMEARPDHSGDGTFTIEYYSIDNIGHVEQTRTIKVGVDTLSALTLNIKGTATSEKDVFTIIGQAESGSRVLVNGLLAQVDADGYFTFDVALKEGSNKVQVVAIDKAGNTEQLTRTIDYSTTGQLPEWMVWTVAILVVSAAACVVTVMIAGGGKRPAPAAGRRTRTDALR